MQRPQLHPVNGNQIKMILSISEAPPLPGAFSMAFSQMGMWNKFLNMSSNHLLKQTVSPTESASKHMIRACRLVQRYCPFNPMRSEKNKSMACLQSHWMFTRIVLLLTRVMLFFLAWQKTNLYKPNCVMGKSSLDCFLFRGVQFYTPYNTVLLGKCFSAREQEFFAAVPQVATRQSWRQALQSV